MTVWRHSVLSLCTLLSVAV